MHGTRRRCAFPFRYPTGAAGAFKKVEKVSVAPEVPTKCTQAAEHFGPIDPAASISWERWIRRTRRSFLQSPKGANVGHLSGNGTVRQTIGPHIFTKEKKTSSILAERSCVRVFFPSVRIVAASVTGFDRLQGWRPHSHGSVGSIKWAMYLEKAPILPDFETN